MEEVEKSEISNTSHAPTNLSSHPADRPALPSSHGGKLGTASGGASGNSNGNSGGNIKKIVIALLVLVVGGAGIYMAPSLVKKPDADTTGKKKDRVVPINAAVATMQTVPIEIRSIGNVLAFSTVNVTPQVGGQLKKVYFTQGQLVKKGDLLFEIDPRQYQAALAQAEGNVTRDKAMVQSAQANLLKDQATIGQYQANLKRDKASLAYANLEKGRYAELVNQGVVSHEQSDQYNTNAATADATIQADQKAIDNARAVVQGDQAAIDTAKGSLEADQGVADNARLQLSWTTIRSPIDGRTSSLNVYEGNIVNATSMQPLVSIAQIDPIYVTVAVPEQYLNDLRRSQSDRSLKMQALIEGKKADYVDGTISFMENTVNTATGTISMRASFPNSNFRLFPGQFVDVVISMPPKGPSVTVPTRAVQNTQQGTSVYIVQKDKTVKLQKIKAGQTSGDYTAVDEGVAVGDTVVTDGQLQLSPGAKVKIKASSDKDKFGDGVTSADGSGGAGGAGGAGGLDSSSTPGAASSNGSADGGSPGSGATDGSGSSTASTTTTSIKTQDGGGTPGALSTPVTPSPEASGPSPVPGNTTKVPTNAGIPSATQAGAPTGAPVGTADGAANNANAGGHHHHKHANGAP